MSDDTTRFARYGWAVLAYNLLVILWGAYVRASGAGAGCGAHWPLCNGEIIPRAPRLETLIEFTHRITSGLALLAVVVQLVWARTVLSPDVPGQREARRAAHAAMFLMLTEALVGAGLVLFEMVAHNDSMARTWWLAAHLCNTFLLLGALALTPWYVTPRTHLGAHGGPPHVAPISPIGRDGRLLLTALIATLFLGMTGAVTALGDTLFPAGSLAEGIAQDFSPTAHLLVRLRILHPTFAVVTVLLMALAAGVTAMRRPSPLVKALASLVVTLGLAQLVVGVVNLVLLAPIAMQLIHLLMADAVWISLVLLTATALATPSRPD